MKASLKVIAAGLLLLVVAIAIFSGGDEEAEEDVTLAVASADADADESAVPDTGRMSRREYSSFQRSQLDVVDESLQFSKGMQNCAVMQTGDSRLKLPSGSLLVGFSDCMDGAYEGFAVKAADADVIAEDALDGAGKNCHAALRSYRVALDDLAGAAARIHKAGSLLRFEELSVASRDLPHASKRYAKFATNVLAACEPR
jgi:hypothetical protein